MSEPIDWNQLEQEIRERHDAGLPTVSVLEMVIGEDRIREAVDFYVAHAYRDSTELVLSFLRRFQPLSAIQRCYEIYKTSPNIEERITALGLLADIKDGRALEWVEEFLMDPNTGIQDRESVCWISFCSAAASGTTRKQWKRQKRCCL